LTLRQADARHRAGEEQQRRDPPVARRHRYQERAGQEEAFGALRQPIQAERAAGGSERSRLTGRRIDRHCGLAGGGGTRQSG